MTNHISSDVHLMKASLLNYLWEWIPLMAKVFSKTRKKFQTWQ